MRLEKTGKPVNRKYILLRLWEYIYKFKGYFFVGIFLTVASNLLSLAGPVLSGKAVGAAEAGAGLVDFKRVVFYCALMLAFYAASSLLSYLLSVVMITLSRKIILKMRTDVFDKIMELPAGYFDNCKAGDVISRISYDIDTVNASLSNDFIQLLTSIITVTGSFIAMVYLCMPLLCVFFVTIPAMVFFVRMRTKTLRPLFSARSRKLGEMNGYAEEIISGTKVIKAYGTEKVMIDKFEKVNAEAADAYYDAEYYASAVGPSVNFINNISLALISGLGAGLYLFNMLSLGDLSAFIMYSRKFSGPINEAANILSDLQSAMAAAERVFSMTDEIPEPADAPGAAELDDVKGDIELSDLHFGYDETEVLHGIDLKLKAGSTAAVVGATGSGKTTLINLLMRFYDPWKGDIFLDGRNIKSVTRKSLRKSYAMVLQDTWLFYGTIYDNIKYGNEGATRREVEAAAKKVHIHDYIMSLPDGYDTVLSDDGVNISKGQKQLIAIARAMLSDARMLILDEATSNIDMHTEALLAEAMEKLTRGRTSFIIAHRLSTVRNADIILVMDKGRITERGTHDELMARGGAYFELYSAGMAE